MYAFTRVKLSLYLNIQQLLQQNACICPFNTKEKIEHKKLKGLYFYFFQVLKQLWSEKWIFQKE